MEIFAPSIGLIFWQTVILLFVSFVLYKAAWGPILSFMQREEEGYVNALKEAEKARKTAEALEALNEKSLEKARERSEKIIQRALATKKALREEASIEAAKEKAEILESAKREIAQEKERALVEVKKQAGALILEGTRRLLHIELSQEHIKQALLQKLIEEMPQKKNELESLT